LNPIIPEDITLIKQGKFIYSGSLLLADISGFTELTDKLALHGKKGTEDLTDILNRYFTAMYEILRVHGGIVISMAGDSILARFPSGKKPDVCASQMMEEMKHFDNLVTDSGRCRLSIKIVLGYGSWTEFIVGNPDSARIFLTGDIIEKIASAEDKALKGEIYTVRSDADAELSGYKVPDLPDSSFYVPGTDNLQGEHRSIAAVFINFEGYDKKAPPHHQIQKLYLGISEIARKHSGIIQMVDNILVGGSRIFLLFGAPRSFGNDLIHAVRASLEINSFLTDLDVFNVRTGIDEGFAFAGMIGNSWSRQYTVIGDVVNTAARLADSAESGSIAVSDRVYRMSRNYFEYRELDNLILKGKESTVRRFSPLTRRIDNFDRYSFVGREDELNRILSVIDKSKAVVIMEGSAGIGKTSLLNKLSEHLSEKNYSVLHAASPEHGETNDLLVSLLGNMSGLAESDSENTIKRKLVNLINGLDDSIGSISRREIFLGRMLFSLSYPPSDYDDLPPRLRRDNLLDAVCDLLKSHESPVCVILEDIHYSTDEDLEAVEYIVSHLLDYPGTDISFILSKRPDQRSLFDRDEFPVHRMALEGLGAQATDELMIEILNGVNLEKDIESLIRERAEGNPFYLMQFLLYLIEEKLIHLDGEHWVRTQQYSDENLPGNVFSMIMARIDRLEKQAKESLRIGSVAGLRFREEIVRRVLNREVHDNLMDCAEAGLTFQSKLKDIEYVFSHTLIKDVTYDSILRKRRKIIHGAIGTILEDMNPDRLDALCPVLASHFRIAEEWNKSLQYSIRAGERAWSEYRNLNAVQHFMDAIHTIENHLVEAEDQIAECCRYIGKIYDRIGDYDKAMEYFQKALETSVDIDLKGDVSVAIADILYTRGEIDNALQFLENTEKMLLQDSGIHEILFTRIECFRAWTDCVTGNTEIAMKTALKAVNLAENLTGYTEIKCARQKGLSYNTIATVYWANGDYTEARKYYTKALELALEHNMKRETAVTYGNIGLVSDKMGEFADAIDSFNAQLSVSLEIGDKLLGMTSYGNLSTAYSSLGLFDKMLETALEYRRMAEELPAHHDMLLAYHQLALFHLTKGRLEEARKLAEKCIELSRKSTYEREEAFALMLLSLISIEEKNDKSAADMLLEAEKLARKVRAKSLLLDILIIVADLHLKKNILGGIMEMITEAEDLVAEMGITAGNAKIHQLKGNLFFSTEEYQKWNAEFDSAIEIFGKLDMKPALADTLVSYCYMLNQKDNITPEEADKKRSRTLKARELESEMGISIRRRSALLQII